ncbi:MAG: aldehyde ferredoxin oxidoreductase C-terminal domain-containing protein [Thermoguttaceae bacterium]|nr:aldehyde ferredoxin oxidoreductase C-terminal domain-containing protein [Thermoguttaceae bacterium]
MYHAGEVLASQTLPTCGTNVLANVINEAGTYPTRNFREGRFEGTEPISGERQIATAAVDSSSLCLFVAFAVLDDEKAMPTVCRILARGE